MWGHMPGQVDTTETLAGSSHYTLILSHCGMWYSKVSEGN